mmetsp:Transcript_6679/g.14422  ORF Transcript_6679/g.14422 Transcript_6679/m.14422 type:complete len:316 (-) Transcript_6679:76-1023(-)
MLRRVWLLAAAALAQTVDYVERPTYPTKGDAIEGVYGVTYTAQAAGTEAHAAGAEARAAEATSVSEQAHLKAARSQIANEAYVRQGIFAAKATIRAKQRAFEFAKKAQAVVESIPKLAQAEAEKAAKEVQEQAIADLNAQAQEAANNVWAAEKAAEELATKEAADAMEPFRQAKLRNAKFAVDYLTKARDFGEATNRLKDESVKVANDAVSYQGKGQVVIAQRLMAQAHDLMDKAKQLEGAANGMHAQAVKLHQGLINYDLVADGAGSYAAYLANPGGKRGPLPDVPQGLAQPTHAPEEGAGAPGPAPAAPAAAA